jgi:hypothetical protein
MDKASFQNSTWEESKMGNYRHDYTNPLFH